MGPLVFLTLLVRLVAISDAQDLNVSAKDYSIVGTKTEVINVENKSVPCDKSDQIKNLNLRNSQCFSINSNGTISVFKTGAQFVKIENHENEYKLVCKEAKLRTYIYLLDSQNRVVWLLNDFKLKFDYQNGKCLDTTYYFESGSKILIPIDSTGVVKDPVSLKAQP